MMTIEVHGIANKLVSGLIIEISPKKLAVRGINNIDMVNCVRNITFNGDTVITGEERIVALAEQNALDQLDFLNYL